MAASAALLQSLDVSLRALRQAELVAATHGAEGVDALRAALLPLFRTKRFLGACGANTVLINDTTQTVAGLGGAAVALCSACLANVTGAEALHRLGSVVATLQMAFRGLSDALLQEELPTYDPMSSSLLFDSAWRLDRMLDELQARKRALLGESAASLHELSKLSSVCGQVLRAAARVLYVLEDARPQQEVQDALLVVARTGVIVSAEWAALNKARYIPRPIASEVEQLQALMETFVKAPDKASFESVQSVLCKMLGLVRFLMEYSVAELSSALPNLDMSVLLLELNKYHPKHAPLALERVVSLREPPNVGAAAAAAAAAYAADGKLKGARPRDLLRLALDEQADLGAVLLTYRSWARDEDLLRLVRSLDTATQRCRVLSAWVELHPAVFQQADLFAALQETIREHGRETDPVLRTAVQVMRRACLSQSGDLRFPPVERMLLAFRAEQIAAQITAVDWEIYRGIGVAELLNQGWSSEKTRYGSRHLYDLIQRTNNVTWWVASSILWQTELPDRVRVFAQAIALARSLLEQRNFCSFFSVCSAFATTPIYRLEDTRAALSAGDREALKEFERLTSTEQSYAAYRELEDASQLPALPFLGVHLTDLTKTDVGNPLYLEHDLLNYGGNLSRVAAIARKVLRFQAVPYALARSELLFPIAACPPFVTEDTLFKLSQIVEPKKVSAAATVPP